MNHYTRCYERPEATLLLPSETLMPAAPHSGALCILMSKSLGQEPTPAQVSALRVTFQRCKLQEDHAAGRKHAAAHVCLHLRVATGLAFPLSQIASLALFSHALLAHVSHSLPARANVPTNAS